MVVTPTRIDLAVGQAAPTVYSSFYGNRKPKWIHYDNNNTDLVGNAELPSGHRLMAYCDFSAYYQNDYYVRPVTLPPTEAGWRAAIYAGNGSYIIADGLTGLPLDGTPVVRLAENAPAKAVIRIPVRRGVNNVLDATFAGWSDGHAEAVQRGMELTVEYRGPEGLRMVFRGQIYQIDKGNILELTAYDRVMDLYQFSDQYQSHQGRMLETVAKSLFDGDYYYYNASKTIGTMTSVTVTDILKIDALSQMSASGIHYGYLLHNLPTANDNNNVAHSPAQGSRIKKVSTKMILQYGYDPVYPLVESSTVQARIILYKRRDATHFDAIATTSVRSKTRSTNGYEYVTFTWSVDWQITGNPSDYFIGAQYEATDGTAAIQNNGWAGSTTRYTTSTYYYSSHGTTWTSESASSFLPEISIDFTEDRSVALAGVTVSGNQVKVDQLAVPDIDGVYLDEADRAVTATLDYFVLSGTALQGVVSELIQGAGLIPNISGSINLGTTDYYTSSTFDYLTCIQEIVNGGNCGIRMPVDEAGRIDVLPRHDITETPAVNFTADPTGAGEKAILAHSLTMHWAAEKATVAILAENATSSGLPIALETDDALMDDSLTEALQTALRGISADSTMGTHQLLATAAGGKVTQLHTNVVEGTLTVAGYRTDIWDFDGSYAGGKPIGVDVPDAGVNETAIPKEIEFANGVTRITLDNVRTADRSEVARSMGQTADSVSNASRSLPDTCWIFTRNTKRGIIYSTFDSVECLLEDGTVVATQADPNMMKTVKDPAGYFHICVVFAASSVGWSPNNPIYMIRLKKGGLSFWAIDDNGKYSLGGQAIHIDMRRNASSVLP